MEPVMNTFAKLCLAGLACALIASATLAANAGAGLSGATLNASSAATMIALNPQPLPPGYTRDDEDDYFRG
jgi:hypothetical protein